MGFEDGCVVLDIGFEASADSRSVNFVNEENKKAVHESVISSRYADKPARVCVESGRYSYIHIKFTARKRGSHGKRDCK